jgi:uncharacterized protein (TIGR00375 family)
MLLNADLHIHSPFSMATSQAMTPPALLEACRMKGISVLGSGDALNPEWRSMWREHMDNDADVLVIPTVEIAGAHRVHHLILMEDFEQCAQMADEFAPFSTNITSDGRPTVSLEGDAIAATVHDIGGLIGPAHAFTPWTGMYGRFESVAECYGNQSIDFLELGLSADSSYGTGIGELARVTFLSNSDAHSPLPHKIGREFTRIDPRRKSAPEILRTISQGDILLNAGFFPQEGKYNRTACVRCFCQYSLEEAQAFEWKCPHDGGRIKKGVFDRAQELANDAVTPRPPYLHLIPLGEIIQKILGMSSPLTKRCWTRYCDLLHHLGNEIEILVDMPIELIKEADPEVAFAIAALRSGEILLNPGGGGKYGSFTFRGGVFAQRTKDK